MKQNIEIEVPQGFEARYNPETRVIEMVAKPQANSNGFDYVDLGLPSGTLWATCNVGAKKTEEYGDYFMWGSTVPNTDDVYEQAYSPSNGGQNGFSKEYFDLVKDTVCPNGVLAPEYDAVHQIMGGDWHMPTKEQIQELYSSTSHQWVEDWEGTGVNGRVFTSRVNANSLFIPASGYRYGLSVDCRGCIAYVWSSSLDASLPRSAWSLSFNSSNCNIGSLNRCDGFSLRGVINKTK